jgi:Sulfatase
MGPDDRPPIDRPGGRTRRHFLKSTAGLGGIALLGGGGVLAVSRARRDSREVAPPIRRPAEALNLVVICLDTVRADHLGAYAGDGVRPRRAVRTPAIDALARESLRFVHARPEALPTIPTRRSAYTGIRTFPMDGWRPEEDSPHIYGWQRIPAGQQTLDQVLRRRGYRTAMVTDNSWLLKPSWTRFRGGFDDLRTVGNQEHQRLRGATKTTRIDIAEFVPRSLLRRREDEKRVAAYLNVVRRYLRHSRTFEREEDWFAPRVFRHAIGWLDEHGSAARLSRSRCSSSPTTRTSRGIRRRSTSTCTTTPSIAVSSRSVRTTGARTTSALASSGACARCTPAS